MTQSRALSPQQPGLDCILASGTSFQGTLAFEGAACVEGKLAGRVVARGMLRVGERAVIQGKIEVDELVVAGSVEGEIHARSRVEIRPGARVRGTLSTPTLVVDDGSHFDGRCEAGALGSESPPNPV